jgi:hypothetical protein
VSGVDRMGSRRSSAVVRPDDPGMLADALVRSCRISTSIAPRPPRSGRLRAIVSASNTTFLAPAVSERAR